MDKSKGELRVYGNICGELKSAGILCILKTNQILKNLLTNDIIIFKLAKEQ